MEEWWINGDYVYQPETPSSGGPEKAETRVDPVRGCCLLREDEIQAARDRHNDRQKAGVCEIRDTDHIKFHCRRDADCRLVEQHPQI